MKVAEVEDSTHHEDNFSQLSMHSVGDDDHLRRKSRSAFVTDHHHPISKKKKKKKFLNLKLF